MKPLVTFPDPLKVVTDLLRAELPPRSPGVTVGTLPVDATKVDGARPPYVMVRLDGTFRSSPAAGIATVRMVAYAASEAKALALAQLCEALLLAYNGGPDARGFAPRLGPVTASDPDLGAPLASLTVAAYLRPTVLE